MESALNAALQACVPGNLTRSAQCLAIDLNLQPYYGSPTEAEAPYIYRSQAHAGTCSFYAYATCYVIRKNKRATICRCESTAGKARCPKASGRSGGFSTAGSGGSCLTSVTC